MTSIIRTREQAIDPANRGKGYFMGIDCAAEMMGLTPGGLRKMCSQGRLKAVKCGRAWRISRDYLMEHIGLEEA